MFARLSGSKSEPIYLEVKLGNNWVEAGKKDTHLPESQMNYIVERAVISGKTKAVLNILVCNSNQNCFRIRKGEAMIMDSLCKP